jgi:methylated-DNA-[protein]-cysteine S-methyltransferase
MARMIRSFAPIIDKISRVLILGTMPGPESLRKRQYYANPANQFWKIIYRILDEQEAPPSDYWERIKFLKKNGIALWDVLETCEREGASDSKIKNGTPNDFRTLLRRSPNLKSILFNGRQAEHYFKKFACPEGMKCIGLPSTSPANARMSLDEKISCWSVVKDFL